MLLLDTHAWIWWLARPEALSAPARAAVEEAVGSEVGGSGGGRTAGRGGHGGGDGGGVAVSSISVWELAMLVQRGRLELTMTPSRWLEECERLPFLAFLPVDGRVTLRSVSLGSALHPDPVDRMIVATALLHDLTLVTKDERIRQAGLVPTIW